MDTKHRDAERRAAEWICKRDGGNWSESDRAALDRWLEESSIHAVAFIRLDAAWRRADRYKALGAGFPPRRVPTPKQLSRSPFFDETAPGSDGSRRVTAASLMQALIEEEPVLQPAETESQKTPPRWRTFVRPALAACAALLLVGAFLWQFDSSGSAYRTPVGGMASVPMSDGSRVTLNTDSEIRLSISDKERRVRLERGEAFFDVAKDPNRPFVVNAGNKRVVAVGTQFSVRRDGDEVRVVVTEGKVRVEDAPLTLAARAHKAPSGDGADNDTNAPSPGGAGHETEGGVFLLEAGAVARTGKIGLLVQSKPLSEVREALSWRSGLVVFRNVDLAEAVAEFNRYNEKKIVIQDARLAAIRLSGKFKATNSDAFVRLLEDGFPIQAREDDGRVVLVERAQ